MRGLPPLLEEHFQRPRARGRLASATSRGRADNPACGDRLEIEVRIADGRVAEATFLAHGCSSVIAVASFAVEAIEGRALADARSFDVAAAIDAVGGLPPTRRHAVAAVARALGEALAAPEGSAS